MLHVNTKTKNYHQSIIHVVCCIMIVYVKTVELLVKIKSYKNRLVIVMHISYAVIGTTDTSAPVPKCLDAEVSVHPRHHSHSVPCK